MLPISQPASVGRPPGAAMWFVPIAIHLDPPGENLPRVRWEVWSR